MKRFDRIASYHISRFRFFWKYVLFIIALAAGAVAYRLGYSYIIFSSLIIFGLVGFVLLEIKVRSERFVLTSEYAKIDFGLFSKNTVRVPYYNIADIRIYQSFLQRFFRYGDIEIGVPGTVLQQRVSQHFSGKGDIKIISPGKDSAVGSRSRGIFLSKFQKVREIENHLLSRAGERQAPVTSVLHKPHVRR